MLIFVTPKAAEELCERGQLSKLPACPLDSRSAEISLSDSDLGRGKSHFMLNISDWAAFNIATVEEF